ncbi:non-structural maintenance of chromosomes element 1 homolog [Lineus longissimus]|uniref:non-structural maintenance of chromosomes element 1 homolog n=1 Tax=Lineus longissimus TaxID=88925 RepID=UPI00315DCD22
MAAPMKQSHQYFLQTFLSQGILDARRVKDLYTAVCNMFHEEYNLKNLAEFVNVINTNIKHFHLEIRKGISEDNGTNYYGLVNDVENSITKCSTNYTSSEFEMIQYLIKGVLEDSKGTLSSMDALNLTDNLKNKKMTKREVEDFLKKLERENWITLEMGRISLGTRLIMEMEQFMKEQFPDIVVLCNMCKRICVKGQNCDRCEVRLHCHCSSRLFKGKENPKCPVCHSVWPHEIEIRKDGSPQKSPQKAPEPQARKRKR